MEIFGGHTNRQTLTNKLYECMLWCGLSSDSCYMLFRLVTTEDLRCFTWKWELCCGINVNNIQKLFAFHMHGNINGTQQPSSTYAGQQQQQSLRVPTIQRGGPIRILCIPEQEHEFRLRESWRSNERFSRNSTIAMEIRFPNSVRGITELR